MKLFRMVNGCESVFVQVSDIMYLLKKNDLEIPQSIVDFFKFGTSRNLNNCYMFVEFREKNEVEFFKSIDFIIDYDKYKKLSDEELEKEIVKITEVCDDLRKRRYNITVKCGSFIEICNQTNNNRHILEGIFEVLYIRDGTIKIPIPEFS